MTINDVEVIDGKCTVPLLIFDCPNIIRDIFSKEIVENCILKNSYIRELMLLNTWYGEYHENRKIYFSDKPLSRFCQIELKNAIIRIKKLTCTDKELLGEIELIDFSNHKLNPEGHYRTSYRFLKLAPNNEEEYVKEFKPITFDLIRAEEYDDKGILGS
jgi:hypothetical protein